MSDFTGGHVHQSVELLPGGQRLALFVQSQWWGGAEMAETRQEGG